MIREDVLPELDQIAAQAKAAWERRAKPGEIGEAFKRLAAACRGQPGDGQDRKATMALYLRYLCNYPAQVLSAAADEWIVTKVFMPAIAEMKTFCDAQMAKLERAWRRAEILARLSRKSYENLRKEAEREKELRESKVAPEKWAVTQAKVREIKEWGKPQRKTAPVSEAERAWLAEIVSRSKRGESCADLVPPWGKKT